jgi:thioredoxin reductase (NADPH)
VTQGTVESIEAVDGGFVARHRRDAGAGATRAACHRRGGRRAAPAGHRDAARARPPAQCPICDGFEFTGRRIGVIGTGAHGARETLFLCNYSRDVCLIAGDALESHWEHELRERAVQRLPAGIAEARPTEDGRVRLVMSDGRSETFDVLYAALGARPRASLAANLGARLRLAGRHRRRCALPHQRERSFSRRATS